MASPDAGPAGVGSGAGVGSVAFREAELDDAPAIAEVHVASWRWAYRGQLADETLDALDVAEREVRWREAISDPATIVLVAVVDSSIAGFVSAGPTDDDDAPPIIGELYAIYLEERVAGSGVGRGLLERAVDGLRSAGFKRASLWVLDSNERARRFYERAGWAWDGKRSSHQVQCSNMPVVRYARNL
ncbi:MAG: GNAT family N-acetyltransferase [Actinomycetota bacterium]